jgi:large-conductance mechanosensitive channel
MTRMLVDFLLLAILILLLIRFVKDQEQDRDREQEGRPVIPEQTIRHSGSGSQDDFMWRVTGIF